MKLNRLFAGFLCFCVLFSHDLQAADAGLRVVNTRGFVRCGTDLSTATYAQKGKDKQWYGIDADLCRVLATAIFGDSNKFELVNVPASDISQALASNSIDVMLGNNALSAGAEIKGKATAVDVLYYDKQMFLAHPLEKAESMEDYKGSNVCVVKNSADMTNVNDFSRKYNLGLKLLSYNSLEQAKAAFFLKRCQLFSANEIYLRGVAAMIVSANNTYELLPEVISYRPVYAYTSRENASLRIIIKWIFNALSLAEETGITSKNIDAFIGVTNGSTRNLLGIDPQLWESYGLHPQWVRQVIKELGNFGEIYERNLGQDSEYKIAREKNNLVQNNGLIIAKPFF